MVALTCGRSWCLTAITHYNSILCGTHTHICILTMAQPVRIGNGHNMKAAKSTIYTRNGRLRKINIILLREFGRRPCFSKEIQQNQFSSNFFQILYARAFHLLLIGIYLNEPKHIIKE